MKWRIFQNFQADVMQNLGQDRRKYVDFTIES